LLLRLLTETPIRLLRLSSVEPMDFSTELLELMAGSERIAKHVHAPLQSGSDAVLRRMYRKYRPRHYRERMELAARMMPDAAFGADVMVGFPGETDTEFAASVAFIEDMPLTYLHVFTYSERPGTRAMDLGAAVPMDVRRERNRVLQAVSEKKSRSFRERLRGKRFGAVVMGEGDVALTTNYVRVELAKARRSNEWIDVELGAVTGRGMREAAAFVVL
jgi:threonylcarbamoyladenosine tRNA methylthiotransferase MtaB